MNGPLLVAGTMPWFIARGTGVVSLVLLTLVAALGILSVKRWTPTRDTLRFLTPALHRNLSLLAVAFIAVHVATVVLDGYAPIGWVAAVVPFSSPYRTVWLGMGAIAFDLMLALAVTSAFRNRLGFATWKTVHLAAYASWPIAVVHALGAGTDAGEQWLLASVMAASVLLTGLAAWRFWPRRPIRVVGRTRTVPPR